MHRLVFAHCYIEEILIEVPIGAVDSDGTRLLRNELRLRLREPASPIIVRLDRITRLDPAASLALVGAYLEASARHIPFVLAAPSEQAARTLSRSTIPKILPIHSSLREAIDAISTHYHAVLTATTPTTSRSAASRAAIG